MPKRASSITGSPQRASKRLKGVSGLREDQNLEMVEDSSSKNKTNNKVLVNSERKEDCLNIGISKRENCVIRGKNNRGKNKETQKSKVDSDVLNEKERSKSEETGISKGENDVLNRKEMGGMGLSQINTKAFNKEKKEESIDPDPLTIMDWSDNKKIYSPLNREDKSGECFRRSKCIKTSDDASTLVLNPEKLNNECSAVINNVHGNPLSENCDNKPIVERQINDKEVLECLNLEKVAGDVCETKINDIKMSGISIIKTEGKSICLGSVGGMRKADDIAGGQNLSNILKLSFDRRENNIKTLTDCSRSKLDSECMTSSDCNTHSSNTMKSKTDSETYLGNEGMSCTLKPDACQKGSTGDSLRNLVSSSKKPPNDNSSQINSKGKIPGQPFIVAIKGAVEGKSLFNCVLCFDSTIQASLTGSVFNKHIKGRHHALRVMEVENYQLYLKYKESDASDDEVRDAILTYEATQGKKIFILATLNDYETQMKITRERIKLLKERNCSKIQKEHHAALSSNKEALTSKNKFIRDNINNTSLTLEKQDGVPVSNKVQRLPTSKKQMRERNTILLGDGRVHNLLNPPQPDVFTGSGVLKIGAHIEEFFSLWETKHQRTPLNPSIIVIVGFHNELTCLNEIEKGLRVMCTKFADTGLCLKKTLELVKALHSEHPEAFIIVTLPAVPDFHQYNTRQMQNQGLCEKYKEFSENEEKKFKELKEKLKKQIREMGLPYLDLDRCRGERKPRIGYIETVDGLHLSSRSAGHFWREINKLLKIQEKTFNFKEYFKNTSLPKLKWF